MGPALRLEIVALFAASAALLAIHAGERYYGSDPLDPTVTTVTRLARVLAAEIVLATLVLALLVPRLHARTSDSGFLRAAPVPPRADAGWRADGLAAASLPLAALGLGLLLPPARWGEAGLVLLAFLTLVAWLWAASQAHALVSTWSPEGRWGPGGPGGLLGRAVGLALVPAFGAAFYAARELSARLADPGRAPSLLVTASIGALLGAGGRAAAVAVAEGSATARARLAEHREVLEWRKRRARQRRRMWPVVRPWGGGPITAWAAKEALVALRQPGLRAQWLLVLTLKVAGLGLALGARGEPPWAVAGLLLVLSDAAAGVAILMSWSHEQSAWAWGAPSRLRTQWAARALPALALSLAASGVLAATAWVRIGEHIAKPLSLWTVIAGASLVLSAANLGPASPPRSALGQNLYGLGLFSASLVSAVFPVVGWAVLAAFALYTARSLARDPRP
jgi:hypothetical protein